MKSTKRAERRHQAVSHMRRRVSEDRNQHYDNLLCPCWEETGKHIARFKEQPKQCSCCGSPRYDPLSSGKDRLTMQERRAGYHQRDHIDAYGE